MQGQVDSDNYAELAETLERISSRQTMFESTDHDKELLVAPLVSRLPEAEAVAAARPSLQVRVRLRLGLRLPACAQTQHRSMAGTKRRLGSLTRGRRSKTTAQNVCRRLPQHGRYWVRDLDATGVQTNFASEHPCVMSLCVNHGAIVPANQGGPEILKSRFLIRRCDLAPTCPPCPSMPKCGAYLIHLSAHVPFHSCDVCTACTFGGFIACHATLSSDWIVNARRRSDEQ
jgi:hypothetical protein